jgi:enoyl-[acyl-carrier-protein] reductase (NADH)
VLAAQAQARGISVDEAYAEMSAASPMQRLVSPADVAGAVVFLASDASAAITGDDLNVSAGAAMY